MSLQPEEIQVAYLAEFLKEPLYTQGFSLEQPVSSPQVQPLPETQTISPKMEQQSKQAVDVLILFGGPETSLSSKDQEFLYKILAAVKILPAQTVCINPTKTDGKSLLNNYEFGKAIAFGAELSNVASNLDFTPYKVIRKDHQTLLQAHPLAEIAANTELKTMLWSALQLMFGIKK